MKCLAVMEWNEKHTSHQLFMTSSSINIAKTTTIFTCLAKYKTRNKRAQVQFPMFVKNIFTGSTQLYAIGRYQLVEWSIIIELCICVLSDKVHIICSIILKKIKKMLRRSPMYSPSEIRTQDTWFKVTGDNHFTKGEIECWASLFVF